MSRPVSKSQIRQLALSLGFSECKFTKAEVPQRNSDALAEFVSDGLHGEMQWMEDTLHRRQAPRHMWQNAKSAIVLAMNYGPETDPLEILQQPQKAAISVYAQNRDYHDIVKGRLKQIAQKIASQHKCEVKVFVDTAPLMEKPLAQQAGLGWQGKHTNLVSREFGSWLFIGTILTDLELEPDQHEVDHCGNCSACLDICPTNAFVQPYKLDARRCISYLTIEHSGIIPAAFRKPIGNRIYGCDDCLAVCPWNKFASIASEAKLQARRDLIAPELIDLIGLDDAEFRSLFSGSPIKRIGRNQFIRNVLIAVGNSGDKKLVNAAISLLRDSDAVVRATAVWAVAQLCDIEEIEALEKSCLNDEQDPIVIGEWQMAGAEMSSSNNE